MSETHSQINKAKMQAKPSSFHNSDALRRSKRPKTPSLLYADGFEDTQKVIGRKGNPKGSRNPNKLSNEILSTSEKETDFKMEEEIIEKVGGLPERAEFEDDEEYLPYLRVENPEADLEERTAYVAFKVQSMDESKSVQRKLKKKTPYGEDYAYGIDPKKPKDKLKMQSKKVKNVSKPVPANDFLDIVLSAAIKAQASQPHAETSTAPKSPRNNNSVTNNVHLSGKVSAPKFEGEDKRIGIIKKTKTSVKKSEPVKPIHTPNDEFSRQRHLEYKDHYIKEAVVEGDQVILKHTKYPQIRMNYQKKKFNIRNKDLVNSKIFDLALGGKAEPTMEEEKENKEEEILEGNEWRKKLKTKEDMLTLHFKELLKDYKPSILA